MEKAKVLNNVFCFGLHRVLQPTPLKSQQQRQNLEKWGTTNCRRTCSRPSKECEGAPDNGTWDASMGPGGTDSWSVSASIHRISEVMAVSWSSHWPEKGKHKPHFKKGKKGRARELEVGQSHLCLARSWNRSSWKPCEGTWQIRRHFVVVLLALLRADHASQIWWPSTLGW